MSGFLRVTGIVLSVTPVMEYDRRLVILTKERGLISAFARGARKPNSPLVAAASSFAFGSFELFEGRSSYSVNKAEIKNYFRDLSMDLDLVYYGSYFAEVAEYYGQENINESERILLLYQSLRALESHRFSNRLIRLVYELRTMMINGECPNFYSCQVCGNKENLTGFSMRLRGTVCQDCMHDTDAFSLDSSVLYACQYIVSSPLEKLYTFVLTDQAEEGLDFLVSTYRRRYEDHIFQSEAFLP